MEQVAALRDRLVEERERLNASGSLAYPSGGASGGSGRPSDQRTNAAHQSGLLGSYNSAKQETRWFGESHSEELWLDGHSDMAKRAAIDQMAEKASARSGRVLMNVVSSTTFEDAYAMVTQENWMRFPDSG